jgi:hypothetical protein
MDRLGTTHTANVGSIELFHDHCNSLISLSNNELTLNSLPHFLVEEIKTDKSDKTDYDISNSEFMLAVFGEVMGTERPMVVSFVGNPATVSKMAWSGKHWIADKVLLPSDHNNYTSFATFRPDDEGKYRRQKKQFAALYAVMLDDVGSKVPLDRIALEPSWRIETSEDNYQIGFILESPVTDAAEADRLVTAIIDAGLTDPGASGPCSRLGRLPIAINGKHLDEEGIAWSCQLKDWQPQRRYTVQQIADGLEIELKESSQQRRSPAGKSRATTATEQQDDEVHIPRADENPVVAILKSSSRYKSPLGDGKHDITCPWLHEHTGQVDQGTAYFEPSESYPLGGFKCLHGHCAERRVSALHSFFEISKIAAKHKPMILVQAGELPRICDAAEMELAKTLRQYQRGGVMVTITTDPGTSETTVKPLSLPSLTRVMAGIAIWQRFDKRSEEWVVCDPPEKHARVLHDATVYPHLPVLNGIARQPYLRADGSLMLSAGYDGATGMFGVFNAQLFKVPATPTRLQAEQALLELTELLSEFAFKTEHDQAAALASILTAVVRPSLSLAPMIHVKAPSIASGKSYLCELLTAFATPQKGTPHSFPADDEECRKMLLAELLMAPAVIEFDNLTSDLIPHKALCTALTSEFISGRILGQSKTAEVGTRTLFLSSGNNVDPVRDMTRRVITISLDPACETPAARDFTKQPVTEVRVNRGHYVSLVLTIVRAWHCAERPQSNCKTIANYNDWSGYCRDSLIWLGLPDPAKCIFEAMCDDPSRELVGDFLQAWHTKFGKTPALVKDAIHASQLRGMNGVHQHEILLETMTDIAGERDGSINRKRLGWWIKRHAGQVVNGLRFTQDKSVSSNTAKWKVESV